MHDARSRHSTPNAAGALRFFDPPMGASGLLAPRPHKRRHTNEKPERLGNAGGNYPMDVKATCKMTARSAPGPVTGATRD